MVGCIFDAFKASYLHYLTLYHEINYLTHYSEEDKAGHDPQAANQVIPENAF